MTELHREFDLRLSLGGPLHTYTATYMVWTLPNGGGGRPHRPWRLTQVFDLCTDPKLRVMIRWHEIKISRPKMKCFRWESFIFWNSKKFSSHCVEIFEQISKKSKNPPETFRFWSGDLHIMVSKKNAEFRGRAQFITIECPQRRCDLAPKTLIFKTKSKVFFWIPYSSTNDRTAPRVWPLFESRRSPSYLYCNPYGVNSTK